MAIDIRSKAQRRTVEMFAKRQNSLFSAFNTLNYAKSADELGISSTTVKNHVQWFQSELGVKLFSGKSTDLVVTSEGALYQKMLMLSVTNS
jgi:biotin operon repressor